VVTPADEPLLRALLAQVEAGAPRSAWLADAGATPRKRDGLADWLLNEGMIRLVDPLADSYALAPKGIRALRGSGK
jgi:ATP-dependent DNA helicase RecQ